MAGLNWFRRQPNAITADGARIDVMDKDAARSHTKRMQEWQVHAWRHYDSIPELWFGVNYIANALRRVRLYPAVIEEPDQPPVPLDPNTELGKRAYAELDRLRGDDGSFGSVLHGLAMQLSVPGEGMLVGYADDNAADGEAFGVYSMRELKFDDGRGKWLLVSSEEDRTGVELIDPVISRVWRPHPQWHLSADSPFRTLLDVCEEILILDRDSRATGRSRIHNGLYLVPDEVNFRRKPGESGHGFSDDPFVDNFIHMAVTPIKDEGTASAVVPGVMKVKGQLIEQFRHMTFGREFDAQSAQRHATLLKRAATGIDLPAEVITGIADLNHWSAWYISQDAFDTHLAPLVELGCSSLTKVHLRPGLRGEAPEGGTPRPLLPDEAKVIVWYDPSSLISHPGRGTDADNAIKVGAIGHDAYRRYKGYTDEDAPTPEEIELLKSMVSAGKPAPSAEGVPATGEAITSAATPTTDEFGMTLAMMDRQLRNEIIAASQLAVARALEKQGAVVADGEEDDDAWLTAFLALFTSKTKQVQQRVREMISARSNVADDILERGMRELVEAQAVAVTAARGVLEDVTRSYVAGIVSAPRQDPITDRVVSADTLGLSADDVRGVLSVAGGANGPSVVDPLTDAPVGGVATGPDSESAIFEILKVTPAAWVWVYGDGERKSPFEAHAQLDGVEFLDWQDEQLRVSDKDAWLGVEYYRPGDHLWCQCDFAPVHSSVDDEETE